MNILNELSLSINVIGKLRARGENVDWMIARSNANVEVAFSTYDLPALSLVSFRPGLERTVDLAVMAL